MKPLALACVLLTAGALTAAADDAPPSIDQLIERITDLRAKQAALKKQEDTAASELKAELKKQQDRLDKLNLPDVPKPVPPKPPEPVDPLAAKLKAAYDADGAQLEKRRESAKDLAELYRQAAVLCADENVATSGDLLKRVKDASATLVGADALRECRRVVATELGALLPTDDALTAGQRTGTAALFRKLATILDSLGG